MKIYQFVIIALVLAAIAAAMHGFKPFKKPCGCHDKQPTVTDETTGG